VNTDIFSQASIRNQGPLYNGDGLVAINDLGNNDVTTAVVPVEGPDGSWSVDLPPGDYMVTYFDISKFYLLRSRTINLLPNQPLDMGSLYLSGWYTNVHGYFFIDDDEDGFFDVDAGEVGLRDAGFPVFRIRDGTQVDRGLQFEVPFSDGDRVGYYAFKQAYPWASWITLHSFHPLWEMTGCESVPLACAALLDYPVRAAC